MIISHVFICFVLSAVDFLQFERCEPERSSFIWMEFCFLFFFFFGRDGGPLCNLVNTGALRVGNVSEPCAELRLAGRANSPSAQPLPSPQKPGVLRRSG